MGRRDTSPQPEMPAQVVMSWEEYQAAGFDTPVQSASPQPPSAPSHYRQGFGSVPEVPGGIYTASNPDLLQSISRQPLNQPAPELAPQVSSPFIPPVPVPLPMQRTTVHNNPKKGWFGNLPPAYKVAGAVGLVGLALLGVNNLGHGSAKPNAKATITLPHAGKGTKSQPSASATAKAILPAEVPTFTPATVTCDPVATIGVDSSVPVDWNVRLIGKNQNMTMHTNNDLSNLMGTTAITWYVCLELTTPGAKAGDPVATNITVDRADPTSSQKITFNQANAALVPTYTIDGSKKNYGVILSQRADLLSAFQGRDPAAATDDYKALLQTYELNKGSVQLAHVREVIQDSYTQNKAELEADATALLKSDIETQADHMGVPSDKRLVVPTGALPNGADIYIASNPIKDQTAGYVLQFANGVNQYTYTKAPKENN